jgi:hypothetical protein
VGRGPARANGRQPRGSLPSAHVPTVAGDRPVADLLAIGRAVWQVRGSGSAPLR